MLPTTRRLVRENIFFLIYGSGAAAAVQKRCDVRAWPYGARISYVSGVLAPCACVRVAPSAGLRKFAAVAAFGDGGPRARDDGARAPLPVAPRASTRAVRRLENKNRSGGNAARARSPAVSPG